MIKCIWHRSHRIRRTGSLRRLSRLSHHITFTFFI